MDDRPAGGGFMKKRIAAVLALGLTAAIGMSSSAQASGDPLYLANFNRIVTLPLPCDPQLPGCGTLPIPNPISVNMLLGPGLGDAICTPENEIKTGDPDSGQPVVIICKQP